MGEVQEIMRQFNHGEGEWQQFIKSIKVGIVDGDKRVECPECLSLPGAQAPERQVLLDLKEKRWNNLDNRFGVGAGNLYKYLDDATLLDDHHEWTTYIGDRIKKSKDNVWSILIEEWCRQCLSEEVAADFIRTIQSEINGTT